MISIVIPYIKSTAKSREIEWAVASIQKNFTEPCRIFVVGDHPGEIEGITYLYFPYIKDGRPDAKVRDMWAKIMFVLMQTEITEEFIYTYDDILFLRPVSSGDIQWLYTKSKYNSSSSVSHRKQLGATYQHLGQGKWKNFETHSPKLYKKSLITELINRNPNYKLLLLNTLYGNTYDVDPVPANGNRIGVTGVFPGKDAFGEYDFLYFNDSGITPDFKRWVQFFFKQ